MTSRPFVQHSNVRRRGYAALRAFLLSIGIVVLLSQFLILVWVGPEGYFFPYPAIDTRFTSGFTEEAFLSIQPGMTKADVLQRLGVPFNPVTDQGWMYSQDGASPIGDFAWLIRGVNFDETGRVIERASMIAYD